MSDLLETLERLADAPAFAPKIPVTREFLAQVAAELRRLQEPAHVFDLDAHLTLPSRVNALAAAAAVQVRKGRYAAP